MSASTIAQGGIPAAAGPTTAMAAGDVFQNLSMTPYLGTLTEWLSGLERYNGDYAPPAPPVLGNQKNLVRVTGVVHIPFNQTEGLDPWILALAISPLNEASWTLYADSMMVVYNCGSAGFVQEEVVVTPGLLGSLASSQGSSHKAKPKRQSPSRRGKSP